MRIRELNRFFGFTSLVMICAEASLKERLEPHGSSFFTRLPSSLNSIYHIINSQGYTA